MDTRHQSHPQTSKDTHQAPPTQRVSKKLLAVIAGVVIIFTASLTTWKLMSAPEGPKSDRFQAVFLDNGQAFFGKLKNVTGEYLVVENAYRAQTQNLPSDATEQQKEAVANNVALVQVGKEVYGPENIVRIRAEQVIFWQNLEPDSKVTKAINDDE